MPSEATMHARHEGHAHDVDVETTFDFLNTLAYDDGFPNEKLPTFGGAVTWFAERGLIHKEGAVRLGRESISRPRVAARNLERIHAVRAALREVADSVVEHRAAGKEALATVNLALHARQVIELAPSPDGVLVDHRHVGDPIDDSLARLSEALVSELTSGHPDRIRTCDDETCREVFYDTSRTGRRRWCDMAVCGNRAKAARHRAKMSLRI